MKILEEEKILEKEDVIKFLKSEGEDVKAMEKGFLKSEEAIRELDPVLQDVYSQVDLQLPFKSYLTHYAHLDLRGFKIWMYGPYGFPGKVFNVGDIATFKIKMVNSTENMLRNVVLELRDPEARTSWVDMPPYFRHQWFFKDLVPGESHWLFTKIKALTPGFGKLIARVSAEVVPFATRDIATRKFEIIAS